MNMNMTASYAVNAIRQHGVCQGTLHRTKKSLTSSSSLSSFSSSTDKTTDYCILVGSRLRCYESQAAEEKGDAPLCTLKVVGASASNHNPSGSSSSAIAGSSSNTTTAVVNTSFRLVTDQGTHVNCHAPTSACRDLWLATFRAGLEQSLFDPAPLEILTPLAAQQTLKRLRVKRSCLSCGCVEGGGSRTVLTAAAPAWQYGKEGRVDLCTECFHAQGLLDHMDFIKDCLTAAQQERQALQEARRLCWKVTATVSPDLSAQGAAAPSSAASTIATTTGASSDHIAAPEADQQSESDSWSQVGGSRDTSPDSCTLSPAEGDSVTSPLSSTTDNINMTGSWHAVAGEQQSPNQWIHLPPTEASTKALLDLLADPVQFGPLVSVSPFLESIAQELLDGRIGVADFLEQLDEAVGKQEADSLTQLKKQAFRVAGDMGSAMKQVLDHALPVRETGESTDMLACILEFILDLCEEGELSSVAFFWPQLCHIHLRMLPPSNAAEQRRVDLVEDFLLTVASRFSIHLALELVWSHTADLEESLSATPCSAACRRRRFAVLRFVCELESLLFDFDGGWGGGSVSLGNMLAPAGHQMNLMKGIMKQIQELRKKVPEWLTRSARLDMLSASKFDRPPKEAAEARLRIARHADYFSSHLNFTKRICDIAEKLRFMELEERGAGLEGELDLLNSSGAMGGDPLNQIQEHLVRVVRVPKKEGHVFRSKERTPVLLLMEIVGQEVDERAEAEQKTPDKPLSVPESSIEESKQEAEAISSEIPLDAEPTKDSEAESSPAVDTVKTDAPDLSEEEAPVCSDSPEPTTSGENREDFLDDTRPSPRAAGLKRFGNNLDGVPDTTPVTPKHDVEELVTNAMVQRFKEINLPNLEENESKETLQEEQTAEHDLAVAKVEGDTLPAVPSSSDTPDKKCAKRMSTLGALSGSNAGDLSDQTQALAPTGDVRREVLNAIMMTGIHGNTIAAGASASVQRSLKELERKRATELLFDDDGDATPDAFLPNTAYAELEHTSERLASLGLGSTSPRTMESEGAGSPPSEEDEAMEAIRLLLMQHRVAQGSLSTVDAAKVLQHASLNRVNSPTRSAEEGPEIPEDDADVPTIDAGDVDPRLVGCGPLPAAVLQALTLWKGGMVTNGELLELVKKDIEFVRQSVLIDSENVDKLNENSAFWGRFAFGERWAEKKSRIAASSPESSSPGWDLSGVIVKSNDDLRQEAFVMQLIELCQEAFQLAGLELWVNPYRILATGRTTGVIEMVRNAMSFDALKKRPGYGKGGLREHLLRMTEFTADPGEAFKSAQSNFVRSLASYSLMSYFFLFKDRHNGNLLLDTAGHVIHIDFGFVFGVAPGGSFSLEMSTPFKLTEEMLEVMGGLKSSLFSEFVTLFCCGFLALQSHCDTFLTIVEIMSKDSTFNCFEGRETEEIVSKLRERFVPDLNKEATVAFALDLIKLATTSYGTKQYDYFQYLSQGIAA